MDPCLLCRNHETTRRPSLQRRMPVASLMRRLWRSRCGTPHKAPYGGREGGGYAGRCLTPRPALCTLPARPPDGVCMRSNSQYALAVSPPPLCNLPPACKVPPRGRPSRAVGGDCKGGGCTASAY